ncbi:Isopentenyl-diphosphate delta-isomerase [Frankliniella fusca]|uniref:Isopentenyl-diphosphate delta-isomerase n=1 Tax=Frankliniella fusca TaxID=407009 RepID=A0AAE1LDP7_9NEOP|nr:Isopentenyl-diphosphate delta-isomerase [Frankliniella fusca]
MMSMNIHCLCIGCFKLRFFTLHRFTLHAFTDGAGLGWVGRGNGLECWRYGESVAGGGQQHSSQPCPFPLPMSECMRCASVRCEV